MLVHRPMFQDPKLIVAARVNVDRRALRDNGIPALDTNRGLPTIKILLQETSMIWYTVFGLYWLIVAPFAQRTSTWVSGVPPGATYRNPNSS